VKLTVFAGGSSVGGHIAVTVERVDVVVANTPMLTDSRQTGRRKICILDTKYRPLWDGFMQRQLTCYGKRTKQRSSTCSHVGSIFSRFRASVGFFYCLCITCTFRIFCILYFLVSCCHSGEIKFIYWLPNHHFSLFAHSRATNPRVDFGDGWTNLYQTSGHFSSVIRTDRLYFEFI